MSAAGKAILKNLKSEPIASKYRAAASRVKKHGTGASMLHLKGITYRIGDRTLFDGTSAHIPAGKRIGLVGANGSGKTTLLRLITHELELDGGAIDVRAGCKVDTVAQEAPGGSRTPLETVIASDTELTALLARSRTCDDPDSIAEIHTRLADIDAHTATSRAAIILAGLGFNEEMQSVPLASLSGGWRMRVALACALFCEPDLLLLDEPSNHLDLESVLWLEGFLRSYPHTLLIVSHDRNLLNNVSQNTLLVEDGKLTMYSGDYDAFLKTRSAQAALAQAAHTKQENQRKRITAFVQRFKAKASKAKQAQSRIKMLERLDPIQTITTGNRVLFSFPEPVAKPSPLIKLDGVQVGYDPERPVLNDLHLSIFNDDRIALLGANGNGKTTLARLLAGELSPFFGEIVAPSKLSVGYFAQDHLERLNVNVSALEQMRGAMPDEALEKVRSRLGRFGFAQSRAEVLVGSLSGGEKTRLALALLACRRPNLLILDEPANHLDVEAREALIHGLNDYDGAIIMISHDRYLIEATVDQLWLVGEGTCKQYFGDLGDYYELLLKQRQSLRRAARSAREVQGEQRKSRKDERRLAADERARLAPLKKAVSAAESIMEELSAQKDHVDGQLADPEVYDGPSERIASLTRRQRELEKLIANAEEVWLDAQSRLENLRRKET